MNRKLSIGFIVSLAIASYVAMLWVQGKPVSFDNLINPFGISLSAVTAIILIFEKYLWHCWIFQIWPVKRPDLRGTWKVEMQSSWIDQNTGKQIGPILAYVAIRQTLSTFDFDLMTKESVSEIVTHSIKKSDNGSYYTLVVTYRNEPDAHIREKRSVMHYGSAQFKIRGKFPNELTGEYWTGRKTIGTMRLFNRVPEIYNTYKQAAENLGDAPHPVLDNKK